MKIVRDNFEKNLNFEFLVLLQINHLILGYAWRFHNNRHAQIQIFIQIGLHF